jgi:hypothetical protein
MTEDLRIDTQLVSGAGGTLSTIAGAIPEPPAVFKPSGADALSTAIAEKVTEVVEPVLAHMPGAKEALTRYAQNVMNAANSYDSTDRQLAEEILRRLEAFDKAVVGGSAGGAPGAGSTPAGAVSPATGAAQQAATTPAAGAEQAGQMGQMMQMPMQLAQQAAQIPMQMAGMAAAIPQAMMQGIQSAVQAAGQASEMTGEDELKPEGEEAKQEEAAEKRPEDAAPTRIDEAAPGNTSGERAPEPKQQEPQPQTPAVPKPAPTRPAESTPEIAL